MSNSVNMVLASTPVANAAVELSSNVAASPSGWTDVAGMSVTLTGAGDIMAWMQGRVHSSNFGITVLLRILVDGAVASMTTAVSLGNSFDFATCFVRAAGLTAGTHTVKVQWDSSGQGIDVSPTSAPVNYAYMRLQAVLLPQ